MQSLTEYAPMVYPIGNENLPKDAKMSDTKDLPEWLTTRQAQDLLKVTTTQGVWNVIERANRYHGYEPTKRNIGTDKKPRYLLLKSDVEHVAKIMNKTDD